MSKGSPHGLLGPLFPARIDPPSLADVPWVTLGPLEFVGFTMGQPIIGLKQVCHTLARTDFEATCKKRDLRFYCSKNDSRFRLWSSPHTRTTFSSGHFRFSHFSIVPASKRRNRGPLWTSLFRPWAPLVGHQARKEATKRAKGSEQVSKQTT